MASYFRQNPEDPLFSPTEKAKTERTGIFHDDNGHQAYRK